MTVVILWIIRKKICGNLQNQREIFFSPQIKRIIADKRICRLFTVEYYKKISGNLPNLRETSF
jgi:hypothetical protein